MNLDQEAVLELIVMILKVLSEDIKDRMPIPNEQVVEDGNEFHQLLELFYFRIDVDIVNLEVQEPDEFPDRFFVLHDLWSLDLVGDRVLDVRNIFLLKHVQRDICGSFIVEDLHIKVFIVLILLDIGYG